MGTEPYPFPIDIIVIIAVLVGMPLYYVLKKIIERFWD